MSDFTHPPGTPPPPPPPPPPTGPGGPAGPGRNGLRLVAFLTPLLTVTAHPGFSWVQTPNAVVFGVAVAVLVFALLRPKPSHITARIGSEPGRAR